MDGDSLQERQDGERAVLKSIYVDEIQEIKRGETAWAPLECILTLGPQACVQPGCNAPSVDLHIVCSYEYPKELPQIKIEKWKRISNNKIGLLEIELNDLAKKKQGEVMIHELAQYTMDFLADNYIENGNSFHASFYEEMMARRKKDEEVQLQNKKEYEEKKREKMLIEFNTTQAAVKKALRRRYHSEKTSEDDQDVKDSSPDNEDVRREMVKQEGSLFDEIPGVNICPDDDYTWNLRSYHSRFENEFEHIKRLGKGAFGDVLKVRNKLDGGLYAVKKIKLDPSENKLNRKTIREAKLLSRLNHENVVRYYNSWIETNEEFKSGTKRTKTPVLKNLNQRTLELLPHNENNFDWDVDKTSESTDEESSDDDYILFKSLSNDANKVDDMITETETGTTEKDDKSVDSCLQYLYIQMELCDKSTLRIAIDDNLYDDENKVWRLFREIVEGLCHIHQQGIIHRDLKPVNIFIGYDEHVKIGDFGLATTIALQKQTIKDIGPIVDSNDKNDVNSGILQSDVSRTGQVGTTLYRAPELNNISAKFPYTQKVDLYSLGIILFEMCHPPFKTGMERVETLMDLRREDPVFPVDFRYNEESYQRKSIRKMLNYDVKERPTSQQLLQSPFLPPPKTEEAEVKNKVRLTLLKPQSKDYKYLIASCFNQSIPPTLDATYNIYSWRSNWFTRSLETVSEKLRTIFQHHGATSFLPPLLTPAEQTCDAAVCLMTRLGTIVYATHDLQMPFARYLAHNPNVTYLKRYAVDKVYRERPAGIHPKEIYQAAFDIVTPALGGLMPEYEMLCVICKLLSEFSSLRGKNVELHLNHRHLISAMLKHSGLDENNQESICTKIFKMKSSHSRQELDAFLQSFGLPERTVNSLTNWMEIGGSLNKVRSLIDLAVRNDEVSSLIESGLQQLGIVINFCKIIGFSCPIIINLGFIKNAHQYSGMMCQVLIDQRNKAKGFEHLSILNGGRYDKLVENVRKILPRNEGKVNQFVTGFTLSIDKLIASLNNENKPSITEVLVCAMGDILMTPDKLVLLKDLWKSGIKTSFLNTMHSLEEIQEHCREVGIPVIVLLKESEPGFARVRTITKEKYYEKKIQYNELIDYIKKNKNSHEINPVCKPELKSLPSIEGPNITFVIHDKLNPGTKRRYESQILNNLSRVIQKFSYQTKIEVLALLLEGEVIKSIEYDIDDSSSNDQELNTLIKKYPRHKKIFYKIKDYINDLKQSLHSFVVILYNLTDNAYKIII